MPSEPFIGEIFMFAGNFAPRGYALCDGQLLAINQFSALFSILGTTYGGDGRTTFGLPDLRGRFPMHPGSGPGLTPRQLGQRSGAERYQLSVGQLPPHTHPATAQAFQTEGDSAVPNENYWAKSGMGDPDYNAAADSNMAADAVQIGNTGGGQPYEAVNPFNCVTFIIALEGIFPSRS